MLEINIPEENISSLILNENFEDDIIDYRMSVITKGSYTSAPGIKNRTDFGTTKAFVIASTEREILVRVPLIHENNVKINIIALYSIS